MELGEQADILYHLLTEQMAKAEIKAESEALLEQEPVLDKIRNEIMKLQTYKMFEGEDTVYIERDDILAIIDRCNGKSWERKPCINYEDGCEEWAGCPCVYHKAESEE